MLWHKVQGAGGFSAGGGAVTFVDSVAGNGDISLTGVGANDLVIYMQAQGGTYGPGDDVPSGWTVLYEYKPTGFYMALAYAYGESSITVPINRGLLFAFSGNSTSVAPTFAFASGSSNTPDPPSLTGFSSGDGAFAGAAFDGASSFSAGPAGYSGFTTSGRIAGSYYLSPSSTEDPGNFSGSGDDWGAFTVRIPAA